MLVWGGGLVAAAIAGYSAWMLKPAPARPVSRTVIELPAGDPPSVHGGAWGTNNTILLHSVTGAFFEIPASGGTPRRAASGVKHQYWRWPELMPRGRAVLFGSSVGSLTFASSASIAVAVL